MGRIRINRNSFGTGVLSRRAQANSSSEAYNYGLTLCRNMIVDALGGAYKRSGSRYVMKLPSEKVKMLEFLYASGKSCLVMFTETGIEFFNYHSESREVERSTIAYGSGYALQFEDFKDLMWFHMDHVLYFYIKKRDGLNSSGLFWSIELKAGKEFEFELKAGYKYVPEPKMPYTPTKLLKVEKGDTYTLKTLNDDGTEDKSIFNADDVGRKISYRFFKADGKGNVNGVYWPELKIESISDGIAKAKRTEGSTKEEPSDSSIAVQDWFISAFGSDSSSGGRLGDPEALSMFQGRLYLGKKTYVFASKTGSWPFNFEMGANDDNAFTKIITTGNMGNILWMYPIEKMIIGTADGVYLIGNTAQYAEAITNINFVATKIGSMGCSSLRPTDAEGKIIFVGTDNRSVYELEIMQDGGYGISKINRLSEDLVRTGIIDCAWQQYPRKIYWCITNDGALVGCSYDKEGGIRAWHDHVLGGKNAYVLQCATTKESDTDLLWLVVRRDIGNESESYLEFLPTPFNPVEEDQFEQQYTDLGVLLQNKQEIRDIVNAESFFVRMDYDGGFNQTFTYIPLTTGHLLILLRNASGVIESLYDNAELNYHDLSTEGFFITAYGGNYTISEKNKELIERSWYLFRSSISVVNIENKSDNHVFVEFNVAGIPNNINGTIIVLKDSGYKNIDNRAFKVSNPTAKGFLLADVSTGNPVSIELDGEFRLNEVKLYLGKGESAGEIQCKDGYIEFEENVFDESVAKATLHTARLSQIKGAAKYNGNDYSLRLVGQSSDKYRYGLYHNVADRAGIEFVANSYGYGVYDKILDRGNGYAYFYFSRVEKSVIEHLIGQTVCYTINGNFPYQRFFQLTDDMFERVNVGGEYRYYFNLAYSSASTDFGLPYTAELETTPLSGGSEFGSSEGSVGTQGEAVLIVYASLGGQFGPYCPSSEEEAEIILEDMKYPWQDEVGKERQLETASIKVPVRNNKDPTLRKVYLKQEEPLSFNILSIVQDVVVADGQ